MDIKDRRKAQGWSRAELAERAALDPRVIQLIELGQWTEPESLGRCDAVLGMAERGEADPHEEAIAVTAALVKLGARNKVDLPLLEAVNEVATGQRTAKEALKGLMERAAKLGGE